ncbi:Cytochrome c, mono-and diheme variants [Roseovarius tolerans]|uniref:Cytochrome c, mono-and diheme variants n=1 Tax=Roseovarius tolerans TaxID=74031 RepID=A0A1H8IS82_9RHOB|nr:cytochrome c [Roseovarius tolerans]SEN71424.1 Cytochrome c, mono-and diheme variants [Roseovarius tolerans]
MRPVFTGLLAIVAVAGLSGVSLAVWPIGEPPRLAELEGDAQRGGYLARAGGCIACHSDPDSSRPALTGGAPIKTGFGSFVPPNLTPHETSGIGAWSIDDFARAVRQGVAPDGVPYYPAFPYAFYGHLSDQDIADMWAAFKGVAAQEVTGGESEIAFPFNLRFGLKLWRAAYAKGPPTDADPERSEAWNRGRWLVNGVAHCGACHTDRNLLGGRRASQSLAGSDDLPGGGKVPAIRPRDLAQAGWMVSSLAYGLKSGVMPDGDTFGSGMGEVVRHGTAWLSEDDRRAMAAFLLGKDETGDGG